MLAFHQYGRLGEQLWTEEGHHALANNINKLSTRTDLMLDVKLKDFGGRLLHKLHAIFVQDMKEGNHEFIKLYFKERQEANV